jgi:hypothetical protein
MDALANTTKARNIELQLAGCGNWVAAIAPRYRGSNKSGSDASRIAAAIFLSGRSLRASR